ncbi:MAG: LPS assembly lipoprotein LptE [Janthinobacterium lividum]
MTAPARLPHLPGLPRRLLFGGGLAALSGCGFRPLYLPEGGRGSPASEALAAIYVPVMPERSGQLLRQALQRRFEGSGTGIAKKYELVANLSMSAEGIAIQRDTSTTRIRLTASAPWSLRKLDLAHTVITTGSSRVLDGYNILNQQYFAADLESEAAVRRAAESLADQIATQLAIFLKRQAAAPPAA